MDHRTKFLEDLLALLEKYGAEFSSDDHWQGYAECGQDIRITVEFDDYLIPDIDLGMHVNANKIKQITSGST